MNFLKSGETKSYLLDYYNFEPIPPGKYQTFMEFPGLQFQVSKEELHRENGRIWLGEIYMSTDIIVE